MKRLVAIGLATLGLVGATATTASAATAAQAKKAAVEAVGGGRAVSVERSNSNSRWEVHVVRSGQTYEVKLSNALRVLKVEREGANHDSGDDHGGDDAGGRGGHGGDDD